MENKQPKIFLSRKFLLYSNIIILIIIIVFSIYHFTFISKNYTSVITRDINTYFKFTNPILDCENATQGGSSIASPGDVSDKIDELKNQYKNVSTISLYVRDLNNGPWLGFGEKETFSPASLLKTPIVMALFKYAETNPDILKKEVLITESDIQRDLNQNITFANVLQKDTKYTLLQIAESIIRNSDNAGVPVLINSIPSDYIANVFNSVGVPYKNVYEEVDLRVKDYASFFRVLFNASYLNREMSEKMLELLSESEYKKGIVAGIPENIIASHKFGERKINEMTQLHDCGVVYVPESPYLLCVMTRGTDFAQQQVVIKEISRYVYEQIKKNKDE